MDYRPRNPNGDGHHGEPPEGLGDDLLRGAAEIARFLFGDPGKRRSVYHLAATTKIPVFRIGSMLCARRAVLLRWIDEQERRVPSSLGPQRRKDEPDEPNPAPAVSPPSPRGPIPAMAIRPAPSE